MPLPVMAAVVVATLSDMITCVLIVQINETFTHANSMRKVPGSPHRDERVCKCG